VTTNQILIGIGLILVLAVGAQVLASRLHIPAIIGVLFISISATVTPQSLRHLLLPALGLTAVLVLVVRPRAA
jgi:NhaP-type Na+/H+ or K+/H+ antiporter